MRHIVGVTSVVVLVSVVAVLIVMTNNAVHGQTAQESVERTIGSLVVQNAACSAQAMGVSEELRRVKAELAELKAKSQAAPTAPAGASGAPQ